MTTRSSISRTALSLAVLSASVFAAAPAHADLLFGAKAGPMLVSFDNVDTTDDPYNVGLMAGYEFGVLFGGLAIEAELTRSLTEGTVSATDLEVSTQGVYLSFTTAGPFYGKIKAGLMRASLDAGALSEDENGETYGIGAGVSAGLFRVELEYTVVDDGVHFVSIGVVF